MLNIFNRKAQAPVNGYDNLVDAFIETEKSVNKLPALSPVEKVQLDQDIAISHLYNSSKIEGTTLDDKRLEKAINAQGV